MVVSRCLLRLNQLLFRVLSLDGRDDLRNLRDALHPPTLLLAVEQPRPQPPLEHQAASCALEIPLAVPDQREHALDRVRRHQRLAEQRGHLQSRERQQLLEGFQERIRRRLVLGPQPRLPLQQHLLGVGEKWPRKCEQADKWSIGYR